MRQRTRRQGSRGSNDQAPTDRSRGATAAARRFPARQRAGKPLPASPRRGQGVGRPRRGGDEGVEQGLKAVVSGVARRDHDGVPAGEPGGAL